MGAWEPGPVRLAPGELEPDPDDGRKHRRQIQWGSRQQIVQGDVSERRLVSLMTDDPNAPLRGFIVTCSRNIINPLGLVQPVYHIQAGVGGLIWDWRNLAPGTYILYAQSLAVYTIGNVGGAVDSQAWAGLSEAAPTLVLP